MKAAYVGIDMLFPALSAIADAGCEILRIFTCETDNVTEFNTKICEFARARGIALQTRPMNANDLAALKQQGCELVLCGGYYHRLPVRDDLFMVNIHPALLPVGRGAWPMPVTILRELSESGVTMHKVTAGLDEGDILLSRRVGVVPDEDLRTLTDKLSALLPGMVGDLIAGLPALWDNAMPQDPALAQYWPCPTQADWTVRSDMPLEQADRVLRAFYGYEVIYETDGQRWELIEARLSRKPLADRFCFALGDMTICAVRARRIA